ncbi:uncharacterized protein LOC117171624 isoform X2 [Belonocnema kinseyi]|uniref:uncharacterized protein LOC117171624 isoform X2 n=1 Tax=Belonocnema kinseyi TaxID=2817044 RepID=UPI00143CCDB2|nr:uncharacterized protein LOC117171624 isoform X2 [Belonocnema kinseyi]
MVIRKSKKFFNSAGTAAQPVTMTVNKIVPTHRTRRTEVLNKLFMKHITDLMATGEVAPQLLGRGIDISHVSVTSDFKHLNVFWHSKNHKTGDESTESVLRRCGGHLQHELSQLRVIGVVPTIRFVKNKHLSVVNAVENRLSSIDFGEEFIPSTHIIKSDEPVIFTKLSSVTKSEIIDLNITNRSEDKVLGVNLPEMRHDVFGLDRYTMIKKVQTSVSKIQVSMQNRTTLTSITELREKSLFPEKQLSSTERRELFTQFLKQRQIQKKRKLDSGIERHDSLEESDNLYDVENCSTREEEQDEHFEIEDENLGQWK